MCSKGLSSFQANIQKKERTKGKKKKVEKKQRKEERSAHFYYNFLMLWMHETVAKNLKNNNIQ